MQYYSLSANNGYIDGECSLGGCYIYGIGIEKNFQQGLMWLNKAAEQNSAQAYVWLGECYEQGWGVKKDDSIAFNYYQKAAEANHPTACYKLGYYYETGIVVNKDAKRLLNIQ